MAITDYAIFFLVIFFSLLIPNTLNTQIVKAMNRANIVYSEYAITACQDALRQTALENSQGENIFFNNEIRQNTVNTYYASLGRCLNRDNPGQRANLETATPGIVLVDYDGYYICYNGAYDLKNTLSDETEDIHVITEKYTWSRQYGNHYIVQFTLSDNVIVYDSDGHTYKGSRDKAFLAAGSPSELAFLNDESFEEEKNDVIVTAIEEQFNYIVNNYNKKTDMNSTQYTILFPRVEGEVNCRLFENPTIISFLQGKARNVHGQRATVFALGGEELDNRLRYFISGEDIQKYGYCLEDELQDAQIARVSKALYFDEKKIEKIYFSKSAYAKDGAQTTPKLHSAKAQ